MAWLARWSLALCLLVIMAGGGVAAAMFRGDVGSTGVKSAAVPDVVDVAPVIGTEATSGVSSRDGDDDDGGGTGSGDDDDGGGTGSGDDDDGGGTGGDDDDGNGGDDDDGNGGDDDDGNDDDDEGDDDDDNGNPCVPGDPRPECQPQGDGFTCRASAVRWEDHPLDDLIGDPFEPFVANPQNDPCRVDSEGLIDTTIGGQPGDPGALRIAVLHATTDNSQGADADAGVLIVELRDGTGATVVRVGVLNSSAEGRCVGGNPQLSGSSELVSLFVAPIGEIDIPPGQTHEHVEIPGVVIVHINHQEGGTAEREIIQRALWVETPSGSPIEPLGDVIVGEAIADFNDDPCDD